MKLTLPALRLPAAVSVLREETRLFAPRTTEPPVLEPLLVMVTEPLFGYGPAPVAGTVGESAPPVAVNEAPEMKVML